MTNKIKYFEGITIYVKYFTRKTATQQIKTKKLNPAHQFDFRENRSTIDQVHRITDVIEKPIEDKKLSSTAFLDVAQAIDKVWHEGLFHEINFFLPRQQLLQSNLSERYFIKQEHTYSE